MVVDLDCGHCELVERGLDRGERVGPRGLGMAHETAAGTGSAVDPSAPRITT